jgi:CysZ protein
LLKEIVIAIQAWSEAHQFIIKHKLWKWIIIPGIIYTLLFIISMYFFGKSATGVIEYLTEVTHLNDWLQTFENSLLGFLFTFAGIMLWLTLMFFYFSFFKYIWLIIGSPLFAYLSEKTESIIEGKEHSFNWKDIRKDTARGIRLALRNCIWQTAYLFGLIILSLVPVIGWITPVIAMFMECYYYGFSMLDYSFVRTGFTLRQSIHFTGRHKGLAVGNGVLFYLMHAIIIFAPAYAIIAATLSVHKVKNS